MSDEEREVERGRYFSPNTNIISEMGLGQAAYAAAPYAVMTLKFASTAGMLAMLRSTLNPAHGVNSVVIAVYQQLASVCVLVSLSLLLDRERRKPSLRILSLTCLIGFLQTAVAELLLTSSLRYITATMQSVGLNMIPVAVFILAVLAGREKFACGSVYGQAKLCGVFASVAGATLVVLGSNSDSTSGGVDEFFVGVLMVAVAVLALSVAYLLVERVTIEYSSDLTLSAMMNVFGTIQIVIIAALTVRDWSSWKINTNSLELPTILYGGIIVNGVFYFAQNWCIHKKGPVFGAAFSPSLVVFSFLFELIFLQSKMTIESVMGTVLVVGGLYLLLWAKTKEHKEMVPGCTGNLESSSREPLIIESRA